MRGRTTVRAMAARFLPVVAGLGLRRMSVSAGRAAGLLGSPEAALAGKQKWEVFRGWLVFKLLTYDWIVQNGLTLYNVSNKILGRQLTQKLLRATVAGQFLGGFSEGEAGRVADTLATRKVCSIWNYSIEQDLSDISGSGEDREEQELLYNKANEWYLRSIELSMKHNYQASPVKLAAIKMTAITHPNLLLKLSGMLVAAESQVTAGSLAGVPTAGTPNQPGGDQGLPSYEKWAEALSQIRLPENLSKLQEISQGCGLGLTPLTESEEEQFARLVERLDDIGERARDHGVRILVDAEESRLQPAIHHLTVHYLMPRFNSRQPLIYNTIQTYLKRSHKALLLDIATAKRDGFLYGVKIVRGAYMEMEKEIAAKSGGEYPVHPNKAATNQSYNKAVHLTLGEVAGGVVGGVVVASHNKESIELALQRMQELELSGTSGAVCFGQQLGMGDHLSYPLAQDGYIVQKVLAYGKGDDVVPFLVRRGQENSAVSENAKLERMLYAGELKRRLRS